MGEARDDSKPWRAACTFAMFVFSISLWIYVRVGLTRFVIALMMEYSVACPAHRPSTRVRLPCPVCMQSRTSPVDGQIVVCPNMVVAVTYDHWLIDGREGVTFFS